MPMQRVGGRQPFKALDSTIDCDVNDAQQRIRHVDKKSRSHT
jgi:hypothetical protein